jgi:hypothetical protein
MFPLKSCSNTIISLKLEVKNICPASDREIVYCPKFSGSGRATISV